MKEKIRVEETVYAKHKFSVEEMDKIADDLVQDLSERSDLVDQKKSVASRLKSLIDEKDAKINVLSKNRKDGYEYRNIKCYLELDFNSKTRKYYHIDTNELVKTEELKESDYQKKLDI